MSIERLKKNSEFRTVYRRGKSFSNNILVLYVYKNHKNSNDINRLGISVSKKVGGSVTRNRTKRLIKESCRLNQYKFKEGYDFVFIARNSIVGKSYVEIEKAILELVNKFNLLR